jgi:hypothetical protein
MLSVFHDLGPKAAAQTTHETPRQPGNFAARTPEVAPTPPLREFSQKPAAWSRTLQQRELQAAYGCYLRLVDDLRALDQRPRVGGAGGVDDQAFRSLIAARWREVDDGLRRYNGSVEPAYHIALLPCPMTES